MALKVAGNIHARVTTHDVKEMWKACDKAKKGGERANYEATVHKVIEKATGETVSLAEAKSVSKKLETRILEYGKARKVWRDTHILGAGSFVTACVAYVQAIHLDLLDGRDLAWPFTLALGGIIAGGASLFWRVLVAEIPLHEDKRLCATAVLNRLSKLLAAGRMDGND
ncbi:MAG: hypothetical protein NT051_06040 [Candidatus Micrarchaeota archaeon]|nr:hypothetical protein [Candidatus Micrarchaeota archaeon]